MYSCCIRSALSAPDAQAMSQWSPQPPAMTWSKGAVTKQGSTPNAAATSLPTSAS